MAYINETTIGRIIREERIKRGLSITLLSKITGITQPSLSNIELNKQFPSKATFISIITAFAFEGSEWLEALKTYDTLRNINLHNKKTNKEKKESEEAKILWR